MITTNKLISYSILIHQIKINLELKLIISRRTYLQGKLLLFKESKFFCNRRKGERTNFERKKKRVEKGTCYLCGLPPRMKTDLTLFSYQILHVSTLVIPKYNTPPYSFCYERVKIFLFHIKRFEFQSTGYAFRFNYRE